MLTEPDFLEKKIIVVYQGNGEKILFQNDNMVVKDAENKIKFQLSCYRLFAVFVVGGISITSGIVERSKKFGFSIVFFTTTFKYYASFNYFMEGNTLLRKKQYLTDKSNQIGKSIIINKIINQRDTLKKIRSIEVRDGILNLSEQIDNLSRNNYSDYEIMGIEGTTAKVYFNRLYKEFGWQGRQPRVKRDEINLLLDIGYTVLFNYIEAILNLYGFDVYKGNLHKEFYKRKSLVCDIIEPFRPIVDYKIRKMFNLQQFNNYKFSRVNGQFQLDWKYSSKFVFEILEEISNYKSIIFKFIQQYYRWFMKDKDISEFPKAVLYSDID